MALKRRTKVEASFIMSSMTDLIFLLLIFFVLASTMSAPNDIKINLPSSKAQTNTRQVVAKVFIDNLGNYSVAVGKTKPVPVEPEMLDAYLCQVQAQDSTMYIALHADEDVAYKEVVRVLDIANEHHMRLVVASNR
jgi:biopolymer transport protein ExbD